MAVLLEPGAAEKLAPLVKGWEETLIWSVLQGCMGQAWADRLADPTAGQLVVGDFCFLAGRPDPELVRHWPEGRRFLLVVPQTEDWSPLVEEAYGSSARRKLRYAFHKEPDAFDRPRLERLAAALPDGCELCPIQGPWYERAMTEDWSKDLCGQFEDGADYARRGIGVCAVCRGELVAGASSYTVYRGGIEIEIDTKPAFRRQGLARACGARLILDCLDRGLYPSWDAQNPWSAALAEQLGYRFSHTYPVYEIEREG